MLIRVNGSSCGVTDTVEAGPHPWFPLGPERLLGYNVGGVVASVSAGETRLRIGDAVWTMLGGRGDGSGAWAEYVAAPAEGVASLSPVIGVSLVDAATLVGPALTNFFAFKAADGEVAGGCAGDCDGAAPWRNNHNTTAVVVAGSGGTGYVAIQLLKALGVRRVVTAAHGASTIAWVKSLGAEVVVDYMEQSALDSVAVRAACDSSHILPTGRLTMLPAHLSDCVRQDGSVDFVYDNHGDDTADASHASLAVRKLRNGGVYVSIVNTHLTSRKPGVRQIYFDLPDALGGNETRKREGLDQIAALVAARRIRVFVQVSDCLFLLDELPFVLMLSLEWVAGDVLVGVDTSCTCESGVWQRFNLEACCYDTEAELELHMNARPSTLCIVWIRSELRSVSCDQHSLRVASGVLISPRSAYETTIDGMPYVCISKAWCEAASLCWWHLKTLR